MTDDLSLMDLFREEARANSATLNQGLLDLESEPANPQRIEPLMRAAHSLKGAARIVGIDAAVHLAHVMEDVFVAAQNGRVAIDPDDVDLLLRGTDLLAELARPSEDTSAWAARHEADLTELKQSLQGLLGGKRPVVVEHEQPKREEPNSSPRVVAIPTESLLGDGHSMFDLFREEVRVHAGVLIQDLHRLEESVEPPLIEPLMQAARSMRGAARIVGIGSVSDLAQALEATLNKLHDGRLTGGPTVTDRMLRAVNALATLIHVTEDDVGDWTTAHSVEFGEMAQGLQTLEPSRMPVPTPTPPPPATVPPVKVEPRPEALAAPPTTPPEPAEAVVRVTAQSLNRLMSLAGESLVQARWLQPFSTSLLKLKKHQDHLAFLLDGLAQALASGRGQEQIEGLVGEARKQTGLCRQVLGDRMGEFDDHAASAEDLNVRLYREVIVSRMRPFADGAHGFPRLVRDMARKLGKNIRLDIDGTTTEVDRDILEKLEAPLTHLIRNAVDHGLETPEERLAAGKAETGALRVEARHRAGMLAITISDDGRGIDIDRLRRKVVDKGLTSADMAGSLGEAELLEFLFLPGFSTAKAVTEFSGRGVGLDVVQDTLRRVGGSVQISTRFGKGTSFHLKLPITLSVLRAVLVEIAGEPYALPHNRIDRLIRVPRESIRSLESRQFVSIDGQNVGLVLAAQILNMPGSPPDTDEVPVVLMSDSSGHYGLIVDDFWGEQDLVVRPLDPRLGKVPNVSAAAILDDGAPVLIADVEDMVRSMDQFIQSGLLQRCETRQVESGPSKRVLVVDDSITVRELERQILRNQGYDVTVAVDGQEGWNMARTQRFDLIVSDVDMPRMTGLEMVKAIRTDPALADVPVIIVSYKEREDDRLRGLEVGANYYLTKSSFHDNTFLQAVSDLIGGA